MSYFPPSESYGGPHRAAVDANPGGRRWSASDLASGLGGLHRCGVVRSLERGRNLSRGGVVRVCAGEGAAQVDVECDDEEGEDQEGGHDGCEGE